MGVCPSRRPRPSPPRRSPLSPPLNQISIHPKIPDPPLRQPLVRAILGLPHVEAAVQHIDVLPSPLPLGLGHQPLALPHVPQRSARPPLLAQGAVEDDLLLV